VELKDYEEVRDIREELLQVLRLLEEEDLSVLLEVVGRFWCCRQVGRGSRGGLHVAHVSGHAVSVARIPPQAPETQEDEEEEKEEVQQDEEVHEEEKVLEDGEEPDSDAGISVPDDVLQQAIEKSKVMAEADDDLRHVG
jgi:hypothetical protein